MTRARFGLTHGPRTTNQAWSNDKAQMAAAALYEPVSDTMTDAHHGHLQPGDMVPPSSSTAVVSPGSIAPFHADPLQSRSSSSPPSPCPKARIVAEVDVSASESEEELKRSSVFLNFCS